MLSPHSCLAMFSWSRGTGFHVACFSLVCWLDRYLSLSFWFTSFPTILTLVIIPRCFNSLQVTHLKLCIQVFFLTEWSLLPFYLSFMLLFCPLTPSPYGVNSNIAPPHTQKAKRTDWSAAPRRTVSKASSSCACPQGHLLLLPWALSAPMAIPMDFICLLHSRMRLVQSSQC